MLCMELLEQGELPDDYKLTSVLGDAYELFSGYIYAYPDTCPKNQEALDEYRTQAKIFLMGAFHMTEEDLAIMRLEEHYLDSKTEDQLVKLAKQRIAEVIYFHETGD